MQSAESLSAAKLTFPWALQLKEQITDGRVFFKMPFHLCPLGWGRFLSADDKHDRSLQCLGLHHAEDALVDDSYVFAVISPFLSERIGTLCHYLSRSLWLKQRTVGQAASSLWTGPRLLWHINCLELLAVDLALRQFRPLLLAKHVLVCTDNTAAVSYINWLGGLQSCHMSQFTRHLLLWSHTQLKSLRAVHIPAELNPAADAF